MPDYVQNSSPQANNNEVNTVANPTSTPVAPTEQNFPPKNSGLKFVTIFLAVIIVIVVAMLFVPDKYFNKIKKTTTPKMTPTPGALSNQEIAKITLDWLDKQRDDRGIYYAQVRCNTSAEGKTTCDQIDKAGVSGHEGLAAIYARDKEYLKTKKQTDLDILLKDINNYSDENKIKWVQNDFWNCKFMYDMWQDNIFNEEQKQKIDKICWTSGYILPPEIEFGLYDGMYQTRIKEEVPEVNLTGEGNKPIAGENEENFKQFISEYSSYPSDFAVRYLWKHNEKDLKIAKIYFNKVAGYYFQNKPAFNGNNICLLGISSLDMFLATQDKKYSDFAEQIYVANLENNLSNPQYIRPICVFFSQQLFNQTKNEKYKNTRSTLTKSYVNNYFDYKSYNNFTNEGNFSSVNDDGSLGLTKKTRDNGLFSILLNYE